MCGCGLVCIPYLRYYDFLYFPAHASLRSSIFEMFDQLLVLSEGSTMYAGPASDAVHYFTAAGFPCPEAFNPSDFFLDLLSPDNRTPETEAATYNRIQALGHSWLTLGLNGATKAGGVRGVGELEEEEVYQDGEMEFKSVQLIGSGANDFSTVRRNFMILCWRCWTEQVRNRGAFMAKLGFNIFFGLIIGGIFSDVGYSQESIQNRRGVLFFVMINQNFNSGMGVLNSFPKEKLIVNRERAGRAYNTLSYFCAKVLIEIPINLIPVVIYDCILYP